MKPVENTSILTITGLLLDVRSFIKKGVSFMSGSGSGSGSGGEAYINVGGIGVSIPYIDPTIAYAQEIQDISLCVAILQMASHISNSTASALIQSAATKALGQESSQLAEETKS